MGIRIQASRVFCNYRSSATDLSGRHSPQFFLLVPVLVISGPVRAISGGVQALSFCHTFFPIRSRGQDIHIMPRLHVISRVQRTSVKQSSNATPSVHVDPLRSTTLKTLRARCGFTVHLRSAMTPHAKSLHCNLQPQRYRLWSTYCRARTRRLAYTTPLLHVSASKSRT